MNEDSPAEGPQPEPPRAAANGAVEGGGAAGGSRSLDRRSFLRRVGAAAGVAGAAALAGCSPSHGQSAPASKPSGGHHKTSTTAPGPGSVHLGEYDLPIADWLVEENRRPGTKDWLVSGTPQRGIEGFLDHVSAQAGDVVTLYADSRAEEVNVRAYRLGWYQGYGGRLVADLGHAKGRVQPAPTFKPGVNMVECRWSPTLRFEVGADWPPGYYLLRMGTSPQGWSQWVPLLVRDDSSRASLVVQSSVTTWQAYNLYGEYSLYLGPSSGGGSDVSNRSRVVSFDRPYPPGWEDGTADLFGNEFPLLALVERYGIDVTYWTDLDLHERPELLANHKCLVSLGHDEYWSSTMRFACEDALEKGLNIAFLGANACYRHIRLDPSPTGGNRRQVCYKVAAEDPLLGKDDAEVTANWGEGPVPRPESKLIGIEYQAYMPTGAPFDDLVVVDPGGWVFAGTGLTAGSRLRHANGSEFDRYSPGAPSPANVEILCHSPITSVLGPSYSDMSYYTVKGGGGVFATGTASFVNRLWDNPGVLPRPFAPGPIPGVTAAAHAGDPQRAVGAGERAGVASPAVAGELGAVLQCRLGGAPSRRRALTVCCSECRRRPLRTGR